MKKSIIVIMAAAALVTGAVAVSAAEAQYGGRGCGNAGVCTMENCPNNGTPLCDGTGALRRGAGNRGRRNCPNYEYCLNK